MQKTHETCGIRTRDNLIKSQSENVVFSPFVGMGATSNLTHKLHRGVSGPGFLTLDKSGHQLREDGRLTPPCRLTRLFEAFGDALL